MERSIKQYFDLATANKRVRERYGDAVLDIPGHETVLRPRETLQRLCQTIWVSRVRRITLNAVKLLQGVHLIWRPLSCDCHEDIQ